MGSEPVGQSLIVIPAASDLGPAMKKLATDGQRRFVLAYNDTGCRSHLQAAAMAGYTGDKTTLAVTAYRLFWTPAVQEAIREEANKRLISLGPKAIGALHEMIDDPNHKHRAKVANMILARTGWSEKTEHHIVHEKKEDRIDKLRKFVRLMKALGRDPREALGQADDQTAEDLKIIDAEFKEVSPAKVAEIVPAEPEVVYTEED